MAHFCRSNICTGFEIQLPAEFRQLFEVENEGELPGQGVIDTSEEVEEEGLPEG
jgi:hypothetical protein